MSELEASIDRLTEWKMEQQYKWRDPFITDLANVLEAATKMVPKTRGATGIRPWCTETGQNACSCDRTSGRIDHACTFCKSQGHVGAMD